ncbi:hypothetical protein WR25_14763 isoform B [Diploscapter pachys]|uniref:Uncharacterized protein n=1 Tax=Diploscapter pachys TaxID=2018661 RepID=A0A2A2LC00_9BILA|nr:hypothetical protein WR25_14763 isoform B [Diploscapter pachys]
MLLHYLLPDKTKKNQEFNHQPQPMPMTQMQVQPAPAVSHRQYQTSYQMQRQSQPMVQSYSASHSSFHLLESCEIFSMTGACSRMKKEQNDANQPAVCTYQRCDPPYSQRPAESMRCEDFDSQTFRKSLETLRKDPAY